MSPVGGRSEFEVAYTQQGITAIQDSLRTLVLQLRQVDTETKRVKRTGSELGRSFRNIALRTAAYIGIVRGFRAINNAMRSVIKTGIEYNETIETSRLGIASLISAQADLITANGEQLEGVEKLDAAYDLATDQVRKLRIAGIQTAATTQELVDAFQQATGAGIASGLTLDEIRTVTIRIAQAAGALGVPYRQLNEEIRSLLSGTIDQNTRIAKALGIRNEEVKAMKEQGRLAEFLLDKFEAFGVAGERIVNTWGALRSNVQEAFELLAGEATFPLFDELRGRGLVQLGRIFDFDTAEISQEFAEIILQLQNVFGGVGNTLAGLLERAVDGAAALNQWLIQNKEAVDDTVVGIGSMLRGIGELIGSTNRVVIGTTAAAVQFGVIAQLAETIGDIMRQIARSPGLSALAVIAGTAGILAIIGSVIGGTAAGILTAAAAITGVAAALDATTTSAAEAVEELTRFNEEMLEAQLSSIEGANEAFDLAKQYAELNQAVNEGTVAQERLQDVQRQMESLMGRLRLINEDYADAVLEAVQAEGDWEEALRRVLRAKDADLVARRATLELEEQQNAAERERLRLIEEQRVQQAQFNLEASQAAGGLAGPGGQALRARLVAATEQSAQYRDALIALDEQLASITERRADIDAARDSIAKLLGRGAVTLRGPDTSAEDALKAQAKTLEEQIDRIKQRMKEDEADLKRRLDLNLINIVQYYDELTTIHVEGLTEQADIFRQLAALYDATDPEKAEGFKTKAIQAESDRRIKLWDIEVQRARSSTDLLRQQADRSAQILQLQGQTAQATRLRMTSELDAIRDSLLALGEVGEQEILKAERIIDLTTWRARFSELEAEVSRGEQRLRNRIQEIQAQAELGTISRSEARQRLRAAYEEQAKILRRIIPLLSIYAALIKDPALIQAVQQMRAELAQLEVEITNIGTQWTEFAQKVGGLAANQLGNFFANAAIEAENFGDTLDALGGNMDSLRNLVGNLLADIIRLISEMIAAQIIISTFRAVGLPPPPGLVGFGAKGGLVTGHGIVRAAGGGLLSGPGTGTSDSILARVSTGEYIVKAAAVDKYGANFLHALNAGALPREIANLRRFATGGLVGSEQPESGKDFRGELSIGLSEGLIVDQMDSPAGERLILKVFTKNRRALLGR